MDTETFLTVDTNLGLEYSRRFGDDGYTSYYSVVHASPYPRLADEICGYGFNDIIKIYDWGEGLDAGAGTVVFIDSGFGALADYLRSKGYAVFGSDGTTELLELDRIYVRNVLKKLGINVPPAEVIKGVDKVIDYMQVLREKRFVKISKFRGDFETMGTDNAKDLEVRLKKGGYTIIGNDIWFVLEKPMDNDGVEVGVDAYFNGSEFMTPVFETLEVSGAGNLTKAQEYTESIWYEVLEKIAPFLAKHNYHGLFCMEGFYDGNTIYVTDVTPRHPFPCGYAYPKWVGNLSEVYMAIAQGEEIKPIVPTTYSCQIGVYTDNFHDWGAIHYDDYDFKWIAYRRVIHANGEVWFVPGDPLVATAVSAHEKWRTAITEAIKRAKNVIYPQSYYMGYEFKTYCESVINKLDKLGYEW